MNFRPTARALQGKFSAASDGAKGETMKKLRLKGLNDKLNCATVESCIKTVDGYETVSINMATGEISYRADCVDEKLLREALAKEGLDVEEVK